MAKAKRIGRQTPTASVVLPYEQTLGQEAIDIYEESGRTAQDWQRLMMFDIMAIDQDGLFVHTKFGWSIPRRNGKNEIIVMRELRALIHGERVLHTAHRTTTSSAASKRLVTVLDEMGYREVQRYNKEEAYEKCYVYAKQFGLERVKLLDDGGGQVDFRTRTSKGGLGEGFDVLVIDEAQEYQDDQESSLKYVVTDSPNPQTLLCGTPPTAISTGTVFTKLRENVLQGGVADCGWAEWGVESLSDVHDVDLWYECNPAMGTHITERKVSNEIGTDDIDFNIQRLGLWIKYNQASAITEKEWKSLEAVPTLCGKLAIGIKFAKAGTNAAISIAAKTADKRIFVECLGCKPIKEGYGWIAELISNLQYSTVVSDGASAERLLTDAMKMRGLPKPTFPTVKEIIEANAAWEQAIEQRTVCHSGQPSAVRSVSNCEKRAIGTNGGFGYKSNRDDVESAIMDSMILAFWACGQAKEQKKQKVSY